MQCLLSTQMNYWGYLVTLGPTPMMESERGLVSGNDCGECVEIAFDKLQVHSANRQIGRRTRCKPFDHLACRRVGRREILTLSNGRDLGNIYKAISLNFQSFSFSFTFDLRKLAPT
ncbi:hypothetical protein H5410_051559 [Solanum commersonii]|uniref:Uncharacterized protein n=1 Tax=Solanum commersonii TaxID=4109 RepID=A0A9J5X0X3_SOLCO|nr:hypothetical protein H5410_051559 [Solanum commersonii]